MQFCAECQWAFQPKVEQKVELSKWFEGRFCRSADEVGITKSAVSALDSWKLTNFLYNLLYSESRGSRI